MDNAKTVVFNTPTDQLFLLSNQRQCMSFYCNSKWRSKFVEFYKNGGEFVHSEIEQQKIGNWIGYDYYYNTMKWYVTRFLSKCS